MESACIKRHFSTVLPYLHPAVGHEFRNSDGAGPGKQLRHDRNGGLFRRGKDRLLRLYAGTGFWKCIFHLCGTELWRRQKRAYPGRDQKCSTARTHFCLLISAGVFIFAKPLLLLFVKPQETEILAVGISYLRIEGSFYFLIGFLFLFYGFYRAIKKPGMSVILTAASLGSRVILAYILSAVPWIGVTGIWAAVPIGWLLADGIGYLYYRRRVR